MASWNKTAREQEREEGSERDNEGGIKKRREGGREGGSGRERGGSEGGREGGTRTSDGRAGLLG